MIMFEIHILRPPAPPHHVLTVQGLGASVALLLTHTPEQWVTLPRVNGATGRGAQSGAVGPGSAGPSHGSRVSSSAN
jgi:hypothetical protein